MSPRGWGGTKEELGSSTIGKGATRAQALRGILGGLRVSSAHRAQG